jgi:hypothetical protein
MQPGRRSRAGAKPEIEQFRTAFREHHVCRFEIAMHDALPVRRGERLGYLDAGLDCLGQGQARPPQPRATQT